MAQPEPFRVGPDLPKDKRFKPRPEDIVPLSLRMPRHVKDGIKRAARDSGHTVVDWCVSGLEHLADRGYRVQCEHPEEKRVGNICFARGCHAVVGMEPDGTAREEEADPSAN